jgi:hypothetical protein
MMPTADRLISRRPVNPGARFGAALVGCLWLMTSCNDVAESLRGMPEVFHHWRSALSACSDLLLFGAAIVTIGGALIGPKETIVLERASSRIKIFTYLGPFRIKTQNLGYSNLRRSRVINEGGTARARFRLEFPFGDRDFTEIARFETEAEAEATRAAIDATLQTAVDPPSQANRLGAWLRRRLG